MILTTHALIGAALGKHLANPFIIAPLAIVLHYAFDTFRHGEYLNQKSTLRNTTWKVILDLLLGLTVILFYLKFSNSAHEAAKNILIGTFFSLLPDLLTVLYWKLHFNFLEKIYHFHGWVHAFPQESKEREWNLRNSINDIVFSIIGIMFLFL